MSKALSVSSYVQWRNDLDANQNIGINSLNDNRQYRIFNKMTFSVFPILRNSRYVQTIPDSFRVEHEQQRLQAAQQATSEF